MGEVGSSARGKAKARKQSYPAKVTNRRRGPLHPQLSFGGVSPKCRRVFTPFFYRHTAWQIDLKPRVEK